MPSTISSLTAARDKEGRMFKRRVVVTGVGLVSALGVGSDPTWQALLKGASGIGPITRFDTTNFPTTIAGEVKGFDPTLYVEKKEIKKMIFSSVINLPQKEGGRHPHSNNKHLLLLLLPLLGQQKRTYSWLRCCSTL